jgi:ABC-type lipopolysaccharide export system ATPase subunit
MLSQLLMSKSRPPQIHPPPTWTIEPAAKATSTDIETLLNNLSIQSIRKLASKKEASGHGTRAEIAGRLKALVTKDEILAAAS